MNELPVIRSAESRQELSLIIQFFLNLLPHVEDWAITTVVIINYIVLEFGLEFGLK